MEFIEAQQAGMAGDALGHPDERICLAEFPEVAMDLLHEGENGHGACAGRAPRRRSSPSGSFATADPAPEIEAARNTGFWKTPDEKFLDPRDPKPTRFGIHALQALAADCRAGSDSSSHASWISGFVGVDHPNARETFSCDGGIFQDNSALIDNAQGLTAKEFHQEPTLILRQQRRSEVQRTLIDGQRGPGTASDMVGWAWQMRQIFRPRGGTHGNDGLRISSEALAPPMM